jgi:predicted PurR-regulated permease PerM
MSERWHLSKAISISHLATTAAIILAAVVYITGIEKDVAVLQANQENMQQQIMTIQQDNKEMFAKIDAKLDQMINIIHKYQISTN